MEITNDVGLGIELETNLSYNTESEDDREVLLLKRKP
jgi:hypothetical protein